MKTMNILAKAQTKNAPKMEAMYEERCYYRCFKHGRQFQHQKFAHITQCASLCDYMEKKYSTETVAFSVSNAWTYRRANKGAFKKDRNIFLI
jgi:hypothetical protein